MYIYMCKNVDDEDATIKLRKEDSCFLLIALGGLPFEFWRVNFLVYFGREGRYYRPPS